MKSKVLLNRLLSVALMLMLAWPAGMVAAADVPVTTKVTHKAPKDRYIPGYRVVLDAEIADEAGLLATRCYFKVREDQNFAFVDMVNKGGVNYQATLPAPFVNSRAVEYLFVVVNNNKQVTRTKVFTLREGRTEEATAWKEVNEVQEVRLDKIQEAAEYIALYDKSKDKYAKKRADYQVEQADTSLEVKTELPTDQVSLKGFVDQATITEVTAAQKYGFLAEGLYVESAVVAGGGAAATGATAAGTVAVATGGLSTLAIVGIAGGVAAVGGGVAAASSGGGGSGGSSSQVDLVGQSGTVRVNLVWDNTVDLDLSCIDPCGNTIDFGNRSATCQGFIGTLDVDANAGSLTSSPAENIAWPNGAPRGNYQCRVDYYGSNTGESVRPASYIVRYFYGDREENLSGSLSSSEQFRSFSFTY